MIDAGWLAMTLPEKPRSPLQRYITTKAGALQMGRSDK
jgi:hypothetical protein